MIFNTKKINLEKFVKVEKIMLDNGFIVFWKILFLSLFILFCNLSSKAQQTLFYSHVNAHFQHGIELFNKEKYAASQQVFEQVATNTKDINLKTEAEYYSAVCAMELFNPDAENRLSFIINQYPQHVKSKLAWYQLARFYYRKKNYLKAVSCFDNFDEKYLTPVDEKEFYFTKGYCLFRVERYNEAEKAFELIKDQKTKYYEPTNYYYAYVLYKNGNFNQSLIHFERVKNNKTFGPLATVYIAQIYFSRKEYAKVIQYCDTIKNNDVADDVAGMLAQSYFMLGNYQKALPYMERFMNSSPVEPSNNDYFRMGYAYFVTSNYQNAIEYFLKVNGLQDSLAQFANFFLGSSYIQTNKKPQAINAFNTAYQLGFNDSITMLSLFYSARLSEEINQQADAMNKYVKFINDYNDNELTDEARTSLSNLLLNARNFKEALRILDSIKKQGLKDKTAIQRVCYYRAEELYLNNNYQEAKELFNRSLQYINDQKLAALSYFWLAEIETKNNQYKNSNELLKKALEYKELKDTRFYNLAYYNMAYNFLKTESFEKAADLFKDYLNLDKQAENPEVYTDALTRLSDCYLVLKNYNKAIEYYSLIITKNLNGADYAMYQKSLVYGVLNQNIQKEQTLVQLTSNYPKSTYIDDAIFELANLYLQNEEYTKALEAFDNLINNFPRSIFIRKAMLNKGLTLYNKGNDDEALIQFKDLISQYAKSEEAREALVVVKNIFVNKGQADEYLEFTKKLPNIVISASVQDSLSYESAFNLYKSGDCNKASKSFANYINKFPGGFFILKANYFKAECDFKLKNFNEALVGFEFVANSLRNDYTERSIRQSAVIHFMNKKYEEAFAYYSSLERIASNKDNLQVALLGMLRSATFLQKPDTAASVSFKYLNSGLTNKDGIVEAKMHIARFYMAREKPDSALPEFQYILKETKNVFAAESKYNIAYIQFLKKDFKNSQKTIFELNDMFSAFDEWRVKGFILLADIYTINKEYFQAKATLESIISGYEGKELLEIAKEKLNKVIAIEEANKNADKQKIEKRSQQKNQ